MTCAKQTSKNSYLLFYVLVNIHRRKGAYYTNKSSTLYIFACMLQAKWPEA